MNTESVIDMIFGVCFKIFQLRMKKKVGSGGEGRCNKNEKC